MKEGVGRALRRVIGRDDVLSRIKPRKGGVSVLMNEKRRLIFQHLTEKPLTHLRELSRETEIPVGTSGWHLKALIESNVVEVYQGKGKSHYYPSGWIDKRDLPCLSALQGPVPKALYVLIQKNPGLSQTEIADKMGKYQQFVQPHITSLEKCDFLRSERKGRKKVYSTTGSLEELEQKYDRKSLDYFESTLKMLDRDGLNPKVRGRSKNSLRVKIDDGRTTFPIKINANPIRAIMKG